MVLFDEREHTNGYSRHATIYPDDEMKTGRRKSPIDLTIVVELIRTIDVASFFDLSFVVGSSRRSVIKLALHEAEVTNTECHLHLRYYYHA